MRAVQRMIAVGVGGASGLRALAWAADEAAGPQDRLVLLRACPSCSPLAGLVGEPPVALLERANRGLARAVAATGGRREGQRRLRVLIGDPAPALADASAGADLLVIGATGGTVAEQVVRETHCPLVVVHPVPAGPGDQFAGHVVVGVDGSDAGHAALDFAFGYADGHRLPVAAVQVSAPDAEVLSAEVEPWELKYPRVRARRAILPGDQLIEAAAGARLLVLGGPGGLARAVTRQARCPVTVVPLARDGARPGRGSTTAPDPRR